MSTVTATPSKRRTTVRDTRVGETIVFDDGGWAVLADVEAYPDAAQNRRGYRIVTLDYPWGWRRVITQMSARWDVAVDELAVTA